VKYSVAADCNTAATFPEQGTKPSRRNLLMQAGFHSHESGLPKQENIL
jgi:hypothetical protein